MKNLVIKITINDDLIFVVLMSLALRALLGCHGAHQAFNKQVEH